eukprot:12932175-Prorocentrum_lima.AAC.1
MQDVTWEGVNEVVQELLCVPRNAREDHNIRLGGQRYHHLNPKHTFRVTDTLTSSTEDVG